jgi:hypothetical protein
MRMFARMIGIDYSGAQTAEARLPGLRVYVAEDEAGAKEVLSHPGRHWSRRGSPNGLLPGCPKAYRVGLDHGFSFPLRYFEAHGLEFHWPSFLDDFQRHWASPCRRACGRKVRVDVPGSVAKSTHAGLPWLRFLRRRLAQRAHFWPFDGWIGPAGCSVITEVYPSLWNRDLPPGTRTPDQHDAYCIAHALACADRKGTLAGYFTPELTTAERAVAEIEGWILGLSHARLVRSRRRAG